jgi:hypothetical protein
VSHYCKGNSANLSRACMDKHETMLLFTCKGNSANLGQMSTGDSLLMCITYLGQVCMDKHKTEG